MNSNRMYQLAIPQSKLLEELINEHSEFCNLMPPFFGLSAENITPIEICFCETSCVGLFENENNPPVIYIDTLGISNFQDGIFTIAHESGHYLHYLKQPGFYELLAHPNLKTQPQNRVNSLCFFRELIANMASFEFFRLKNLLGAFLTTTKQEVLADWERIDRMGDYRRGAFGVLTHYYVYQKFRNENGLPEINAAIPTDFNLFRRTDLLVDEAKSYLSEKSSRVEGLYAVPSPSEPTLFD